MVIRNINSWVIGNIRKRIRKFVERLLIRKLWFSGSGLVTACLAMVAVAWVEGTYFGSQFLDGIVVLEKFVGVARRSG